jgi:hypothetical protein
MMHILYLPSWLPNRTDPYSGDFIKRYAESASLYNRITVFFTAIDTTIKESELTEERVNDNLTIYIHYYPSQKGIFYSCNKWSKRFSALRSFIIKFLQTLHPTLYMSMLLIQPDYLHCFLKKKRIRIHYFRTRWDLYARL